MAESDVLIELSKSILSHLGVEDDDFTLSNFLLSLYEQSKESDEVSIRSKRFEEVVRQNGGDEFPRQLIDEAFKIMDEKMGPVKTKREKDQDQCIPLVKKEEIEFKGLVIPNVKPKIEEEDYEVQEHKIMPSQFKREEYVDDKTKIQQIEILVGDVVRGVVSNLAPYGAFIKFSNGQSGLCHVSKISNSRVEHPQDILKINQEVFVKVEKIESVNNNTGGRYRQRDKISLSMRDVDQVTGMQIEREERGRSKRLYEESSGVDGDRVAAPKRRLTSPERWEIRQLIASGAISASEYPELGNEDPDAAFQSTRKKDSTDTSEVEVDIELNDEEPPFLKGQTKSSIELAPVKIIKNPEGSLGRAAQQGSLFVKDFREAKANEQKQKEIEERRAKSSASHLDPLAPREKETSISKEEVVPWKKIQSSVTYGKRTQLSMKEQRESLPVFGMRSEIISAVKNNQFLVIVGETGSGKTTQIVQYLAEEGLNKNGKLIGCTQPRRVAAQSVATRVAEEVGCKVGQEVGYTIRFEDKTSPDTIIKYMTDGMLQKEALSDPMMSRYSVIMLDEAHERTVATDILFALLKEAARNNPNLKILVTSATLDSTKFSNYFNNCPILNIPGRTFPVEIMYTREPELDYMAATLDSVAQIHISEPIEGGDILVFLTGQEEIDTACEALYNRIQSLGASVPELIILPVYSSLPSEIQSKIFEPTPQGSRKCIFATNIAETSITIDGVFYVIDPGFVKINAYDSKLGMDLLIVSPISQAQAKQRSGRAGRTGPGKCYRLYTEQAFKTEMLPNTIPEIQRQNLSSTILMLKAMGINDLINFEFMDPPPINTMINALQELFTLEALDDDGMITKLGRKMAEFPMNPALAKTLITSADKFGCSEEILTIVAMLSVQTIFYRPREKQQLADQRKSRFHHSQGDHLTFLNVYRAWQLSGFSKQWCKDNFIQERSMRRAQEVRKQLVTILRKHNHPIISCGMELDKVRRALCSGFFKFAAKRDSGGGEGGGGYKSLVEQTPVYMHPLSALFGKSPDYVIYHTLLLTSKEYMHCVTVIDPKWLTELAPSFFKQADPNNVNSRKKREKIIPLFDKFSKDQNAWRLSSKGTVKTSALKSLREK